MGEELIQTLSSGLVDGTKEYSDFMGAYTDRRIDQELERNS